MKPTVLKISGKQLMTSRSKYAKNADAKTAKNLYQKWRLFNEHRD